MTGTVLVVEDDTTLATTLRYNLEREGYNCLLAADGARGLELARRDKPSLVLLDVMLPGIDGLEVCRRVRAESNVPIIMLTARVEELDRVVGLEVGADDYVTKPFSLLELRARILAVLKRAGGAKSVYRYAEVEVDLDNYVIRHGDVAERLSNREQELLKYLIEHRGKVLDREELLSAIWKYSPGVTTRTVDTHILNVRKKLRDDAGQPKFIETFHGIGYKFVGEEK